MTKFHAEFPNFMQSLETRKQCAKHQFAKLVNTDLLQFFSAVNDAFSLANKFIHYELILSSISKSTEQNTNTR